MRAYAREIESYNQGASPPHPTPTKSTPHVRRIPVKILPERMPNLLAEKKVSWCS